MSVTATDFSLNLTKGRNYRILQLTDMQVIDSSQRRRPDRLVAREIEAWRPSLADANCYAHIRRLVKAVKPDAIIITGDIVYGEFDDSGIKNREFAAFMGSLGIPWAPVFGNHDNESEIGVEAQCGIYSEAENCLFARGNVSGNSNCTIGLYEDGSLVRALYMMDSNACSGRDPSICRRVGFAEDQIQWLKSSADRTGRVPGFLCCHIPTMGFYRAILAAGYQNEENIRTAELCEIGRDTVPVNEGDCGYKQEALGGIQYLHELYKEYGIDGEFAGHYHNINMSVAMDGVRYTLGVKCGTYDYHTRTGGTVIDISPDRAVFTVTPRYGF